MDLNEEVSKTMLSKQAPYNSFLHNGASSQRNLSHAHAVLAYLCLHNGVSLKRQLFFVDQGMSCGGKYPTFILCLSTCTPLYTYLP